MITVEQVGTVAELHALAMPQTGDTLQAWIMRPTKPAVAMGSAQKPDRFRTERLRADGVELAGRRSGGGAVYIEPAGVAWVDLLVPKTHSLWSSDLAVMFERVGALWQRALADCGVATDMYSAPAGAAPSSRNEVARLACWAGVGWGELLVGDTKVVGLSQRRTRWGARVQGMAVLDSSAHAVVDYLDVHGDVAEAIRAAMGAPIEVAVDWTSLVAAVLTSAVGNDCPPTGLSDLQN